MTSSDRLTNRTRRGLPDRLSSPRNSVSGTTLSNRSTDATNFLHITKKMYGDTFDKITSNRTKYLYFLKQVDVDGRIIELDEILKKYDK